MLVRLEKKGYIRHEEEGVRYIYSATTSPAAARRAALHQYLRVFFGGSRSRMMTALLRQEAWTDEELDALRAEIERVRKERK
jgi:predicted transcriptional regulator